MKSTLFPTRSTALIALLFLFAISACKKESGNVTPQAKTSVDLKTALQKMAEFENQNFNEAEIEEELAADDRDNPNPQAYPPRSKQFGVLAKDWTAEWWKRMLSFPCGTNPLFDTGTYDDVNQPGSVFHLAGTTGGTAVRNVTVPAGKSLFFPLVNLYWDNPCPPDPTDAPKPGQTLEQYLKFRVNSFIKHAGNLSVTLDGVAFTELERYKIRSDMFTHDSAPGLETCFEACLMSDPTQSFMSHGYWVMLKPLSPGQHTLNFTGGFPAFGFSVNVTYNITQL